MTRGSDAGPPGTARRPEPDVGGAFREHAPWVNHGVHVTKATARPGGLRREHLQSNRVFKALYAEDKPAGLGKAALVFTVD